MVWLERSKCNLPNQGESLFIYSLPQGGVAVPKTAAERGDIVFGSFEIGLHDAI